MTVFSLQHDLAGELISERDTGEVAVVESIEAEIFVGSVPDLNRSGQPTAKIVIDLDPEVAA